MSCYAVLWSEPRRDVYAGKLELGAHRLSFAGSHEAAVRLVSYSDIETVRIGRHAAERLAGKPTVVLELGAGGSVRVGSVEGTGTITELADELVRLTR